LTLIACALVTLVTLVALASRFLGIEPAAPLRGMLGEIGLQMLERILQPWIVRMIREFGLVNGDRVLQAV
jgi:hypothetical protein